MPLCSPHNLRRCRQRCQCVASGFSLIELLVTLAVIAVLSLIGFSLVGSARESANSSRNAANLRTLAIASFNYANDNSGRLPQATQRGSDGMQVSRRTIGNHANTNAPPFKLIAPDPEYRDGERYVDSAEAFYGPFTPLLEAQRIKGRFMSTLGTTDSTGPFKLGYVFYSLPGETDNSVPPREPYPYGIHNNRISESTNMRTPLYSDILDIGSMTDETGFNAAQFMVIHLDGSITLFEREQIRAAGSTAAAIYLMSGVNR